MNAGTTVTSRFLGRRQLHGLDRLGDAMVPGEEDLPSFSRSGCAVAIDSVLQYLPPGDRKDLGLLLKILGLMPAFLVGGFVVLVERAGSLPGPLGTLLRFARIGTRGLVMSLYFSHPPVLDAIGYEVGVVMEDAPVAPAST